MPTSTSEPAPLAGQPHQQRGMAESFGVDPDRYDRTRPSYPGAMVARILAASPGTEVLDVGCGTGTAARQFQAAGCRVLGVEPDARMAEFARIRGLAVEVARFEEWDDAGRAFHAVVAGTAWHWIDPVAGAAKAARVLLPGGRLALFWHVFQPPAELAGQFAEVYRQVVPNLPVPGQVARQNIDLYQPILARTADGIRAAGGFGEPDLWHYEWTRDYRRAEWLDQLPTSGILTQLPADQVAAIQAGIGAIIDAAGGSFTMSYTTAVVTAART